VTLRVVHVIKSLGLGGAERLLVDGAAVAPSLGMRHEVVSFLPWKDALLEDLRAVGAEVTVLPRSNNVGILAAADVLARHLRTRRADVVHGHLPIACVVSRLAARLAGIPCVTTGHNVFERYHPATRALELVTWPLQQAVVACSAEVKASMDRWVPSSSSRRPPVFVVPNGIAPARFVVDVEVGRAARRGAGIDEDAFVVGTVAVHRTQKSLDRWLRVADRVRAKVPGARFLLVGDGPLRASLEQQARDMGLGDAVVFPGLQRDPAPWLAAMDVWLSTSTFEGMPLALLEALAARRAVVATAVGGVPEVIDDGRQGRLLPPGDEDGLVAAVCALADDADSRRRLGDAGAALVDDRFGMERMQRALRDVYGVACR
jgi:glycosyltransferase involved in cell wall biosynthesis